MTRHLALCILFIVSTSYATEDTLPTTVHTHDAERFAALFTAGRVSAAELQLGYLDNASRGVQIFTPGRIQSAANLAHQVSKLKLDYAHAISTCLPVVGSLNIELRGIYSAYRELLPELPLPRVYVVFGTGNSGGTAEEDAQVLALETLCKVGTTVPQFRATMRRYFAHETVHTWQRPPADAAPDRLLLDALLEGVPDLLSELVTGLEPDPGREAWARPREAEIWRRFSDDRLAVESGDVLQSRAASGRWFANAGQRFENLPDGWPSELGYWVGRNIARAYFANAANPREALLRLISAHDPAEILQASGYAPR